MDQKQYETKSPKQNYLKKPIHLKKREKLTDSKNLSRPPDLNSKFTKKVSNLQDPLDNIPLSKNENQNIVLPITETITV